MYMSVIGQSPGSEVLRELQGARVLLTGLSAEVGVDIARAFADARTRLVVQTNELTPDMTALVALLSQNAAEFKLYTNPIDQADASVRFAQAAQQAFGGLDAVINLQTLSKADMLRLGRDSDIEHLIAGKLVPLTHITRVAANRMRVILRDGMILNVLTAPRPTTAREAAICGYARAALAAMTRGEASQWADQAVRINAVGPRTDTDTGSGACLTNEPDIAALALYLASKRGRSLSGHVFDAERSNELTD